MRYTHLLRVFVLLLLFRCAAVGQSSTPSLRIAPAPQWVEGLSQEPVEPGKPDQESNGQFLKLIETQINVVREETFVHVVKEITSTAGVQNGANLEFSWDPSFQEIALHQITIQRGSERMDRLDLKKFKVLQQETDLDRHIYNGTLSAVLFLEDVRVGDRIEYAYTVRGENPSLKGKYSNSLLMGFAVPIRHKRVRLVWPTGRELRYMGHGNAVKPELRNGSVREYVWDLHDVPGIMAEDQAPSWFPVYPWIQLSEFGNWSEVSEWATKLFATTNLNAPELKAQIQKLRSSGDSPEQTVQKALDFTQNEIRYLGIEFGPNSYRPSDPVAVLERRFGDCKDKAFLLCTLLRGLGFNASPVLVATGFRHTLSDLLPAPQDFDHVIVRVDVGRSSYWLDPTRSYQRGPISQRYLPDFGLGLVVGAGSAGLTAIPACIGGPAETTTLETFHLGGQKEIATLSVTTICKGFDAEWMRAILASGRERMAKSYLNDYAQRYPGIQPARPMEIQDPETADSLCLIHTYTIKNFWALSQDKNKYNCQFYPLGIETWIHRPSTAVRSMPLDLPFPRRRTVKTTIMLPREFKITNITNTIAGPASELRVKRGCEGRVVSLCYEYRAQTNCVPASLVGAHLNSLDQMENSLGYSLSWQSLDAIGSKSQVNWPILILSLVYAALVVTLATFAFWKHCAALSASAPSEPPPVDDKLVGLGGWLILVGFGLVISPFRLVLALQSSAGAFAVWKWNSLTHTDGMSYHPMWAPLLIFELLGQITMMVLTLFVLVSFWQKRRMFPKWYIVLLALNAVIVTGDVVGLGVIDKGSATAQAAHLKSVFQAAIACAIWIPYLRTSRRVKLTFVQ
jgi:transglutaminase-like putative cysteine protease